MLPGDWRRELPKTYGLSEYDAALILDDPATVSYFENTARFTKNYKAVVNWLMGPVRSYLNEAGLELDELRLYRETSAGLTNLCDDGKDKYTMVRKTVLS